MVTIEHLRLFRNRLGLRFEYPIHEQVAPLAQRMGLVIAQTNITIEHIGYAVGSGELKAKAKRNLELINKCLAKEPDNPYWRFHLGVNLFTVNDWAAAIGNFEAVLADPSPGLDTNSQLYEANVLLIAAYSNMALAGEAFRALNLALETFPNRRHLWILAGKFYLTQNEPDAAIQAFEFARTLPIRSDRVGMIWPDGTLEAYLCQAYLQQGKAWHKQGAFEQMAEALARAIETAPESERAQVYKLLAVALHKTGREDDALLCWQAAQVLEPVDPDTGNSRYGASG